MRRTSFAFQKNAPVYRKTLKFGYRVGYKLLYKNTKAPDTGIWLRDELVRMGPTYVKIGQIISSRTDLFPEYITNQLVDLQNNVTHIPLEDLLPVIEDELNCALEEQFLYFSKDPIASASIGQVHFAVLKNKKKVVVKVQKPYIEESIKEELSVITSIVKAFSVFKNKQIDDVLMIIEESCKNINIETDFNIEQKNMQTFRTIMAKNENVIIPRVYSKMSSKRLLVMEYVPGKNINTNQLTGVDTAGFAKNMMKVFIQTLLQYGYLHADPHAGNFAIGKDGQMILYDFGIVAKYDLSLKTAFRNIVMGFLSKDVDSVLDQLLSNEIVYVHSKAKCVQELTDDEYVVMYKIVTYLFKYSENIDVDVLTRSILRDSYIDLENLPFYFDSKMILLFKTITVLEGVCKTLDKDFNYYQLLDELINDLIDVRVMINKIKTDIEQIYNKMNSNSTSTQAREIPYEKMYNMKIDKMDKELSEKYLILIASSILSVMINIL